MHNYDYDDHWRWNDDDGVGDDGNESAEDDGDDEIGMLCRWPTFGFAKGEERGSIQQYRKFSPIPNIWAFKLHKTATKIRQQMKKSIFFVDLSQSPFKFGPQDSLG